MQVVFSQVLFLHWGDVKAIIFYVSLFPVFIDLSTLKVEEILLIIGIAMVSVGSVKALYAVSAVKIVDFARKLKFENEARKIAGGAMIGAGSYLIVKA